MSKKITMPENSNPITVTINNKVYQYKGGETIEVPDEVAEVIQRNKDVCEASQAQDSPGKNTMLCIKVWQGEAGWVCDTQNEKIFAAIKSGRAIVCDKLSGDDVSQTIGYTKHTDNYGVSTVTIGEDYSFEYIDNGYDIAKDVECGKGLNVVYPYALPTEQRQCFYKDYLSFEAGSTIAVSMESAKDYNVALWFISKTGAKKVVLGENIASHVTDTGWKTTPMTSVVPNDTAYVWVNLKRTDDGVCGIDDIARLIIRQLP